MKISYEDNWEFVYLYKDGPWMRAEDCAIESLELVEKRMGDVGILATDKVFAMRYDNVCRLIKEKKGYKPGELKDAYIDYPWKYDLVHSGGWKLIADLSTAELLNLEQKLSKLPTDGSYNGKTRYAHVCDLLSNRQLDDIKTDVSAKKTADSDILDNNYCTPLASQKSWYQNQIEEYAKQIAEETESVVMNSMPSAKPADFVYKYFVRQMDFTDFRIFSAIFIKGVQDTKPSELGVVFKSRFDANQYMHWRNKLGEQGKAY
jgi:hypothetical protein